jgi:ketosteroid isomerase-like protein
VNSEEPTTPDSVELTRRLIAAFDLGDVEAIMDFGTADAVLDATALGLHFEGPAAIRGFLEEADA